MKAIVDGDVQKIFRDRRPGDNHQHHDFFANARQPADLTLERLARFQKPGDDRCVLNRCTTATPRCRKQSQVAGREFDHRLCVAYREMR